MFSTKKKSSFLCSRKTLPASILILSGYTFFGIKCKFGRNVLLFILTHTPNFFINVFGCVIQTKISWCNVLLVFFLWSRGNWRLKNLKSPEWFLQFNFSFSCISLLLWQCIFWFLSKFCSTHYYLFWNKVRTSGPL